MQSIKTIYKYGAGPSSSHTMGPQEACTRFINEVEINDKIVVDIYGSLSLTGRGHFTDKIISKTLVNYEHEIIFHKEFLDFHENAMKLTCGDTFWYVYSVGGGDIVINPITQSYKEIKHDIYIHNNFSQIKTFLVNNNIDLLTYIYQNEPTLKIFLSETLNHMKKSLLDGLNNEGELPGKLKVSRRAKMLLDSGDPDLKLSAYAYAVSEENACGSNVVTAPTCGACGVLPATLFYNQELHNYSDEDLIDALAIAGLFGLITKTNASISGAEAGCQAEIGTATAMSAAALTFLKGGSLKDIESAAEIGMEHQLGLTCDPIAGYVQIPCIQRNVMAASKTNLACALAMSISADEKIDFDSVVHVMYETGKDLASEYRETSKGGLAKIYNIMEEV